MTKDQTPNRWSTLLPAWRRVPRDRMAENLSDGKAKHTPWQCHLYIGKDITDEKEAARNALTSTISWCEQSEMQFNPSTPLSTWAVIFGISRRASGERSISSIFKTPYVSVTHDPTSIKKMLVKVLDTEI